MKSARSPFDPTRDLVLERVVNIAPELVWAAWTKPEHIVHWFTPDPWKTVDCEIDLRPGGLFKTIMRSPEGQEFPNIGAYLEVVENESLIWTSMLGPGFRPVERVVGCADIQFTCILTFERVANNATKYTALAIHPDAASCKQHADMGFHDGWSAALDQLVAHMTGKR